MKCVDPSTQSILAQVIDAQEATIIVAEHGTLSYAALWARDETILITIGSELHIKEPHVLPFVTYLHVFYMVYEHKNDLEGLVHHAFQLLIQKRLFNLTYDTADKTYKHQQDVENQCTSTSPPQPNQLLMHKMPHLNTKISSIFQPIHGDDDRRIGLRFNVTLTYGDNENGHIDIRPNDILQMDILYGDSVHKTMLHTFPDYRTFPSSVYVDFSYSMSKQLYGVYYTPTLPIATNENYVCSQYWVLAKMATGLYPYFENNFSYLEISADRTLLFDRVVPLFNYSVYYHVNDTDILSDRLYHIIYINVKSAVQIYQYVKVLLKILAPSGCLIFPHCLPGHQLHATFPREPGSNIWYGNTWKV